MVEIDEIEKWNEKKVKTSSLHPGGLKLLPSHQVSNLHTVTKLWHDRHTNVRLSVFPVSNKKEKVGNFGQSDKPENRICWQIKKKLRYEE